MDFSAITRFGGKIILKAKQRSPEILLVVGIGTGIAAVITACKATKHVDEIVDETHYELDRVSLHVKPEKSDYFKVYCRAGLKFAKLYGPSIALEAVSIGCLIGSHGILNKRYLGVTAAYAALDDAFRKYRGNVVEKLGEEAEKKLYLGLEDKKDKKESDGVTEDYLLTPDGIIANPAKNASPYAMFFDESCNGWRKDAEWNRTYLRGQQRLANNMFNTKGYLFLNEVYDMLGHPITRAGQVVGWVKGAGDDYIDFGIDNPLSEEAISFVNGYERNILLDFNVDGVILDKI